MDVLHEELNLGNFIDRLILVKLNPEGIYLPMTGKAIRYFDVRLGCIVCGKGDVYSFKTNIGELLNIPENMKSIEDVPEDLFLLNDITIKPSKYYKDINFPIFYLCKDRSLILPLRELYEYFQDTKVLTRIRYNEEDKKFNFHNSGISSEFTDDNMILLSEDKLDNVGDIRLCPHCYFWFKRSHEVTDEQFVEINFFEAFWRDFIRYDLEEFTFNNPSDKGIVENIVI